MAKEKANNKRGRTEWVRNEKARNSNHENPNPNVAVRRIAPQKEAEEAESQGHNQPTEPGQPRKIDPRCVSSALADIVRRVMRNALYCTTQRVLSTRLDVVVMAITVSSRTARQEEPWLSEVMPLERNWLQRRPRRLPQLRREQQNQNLRPKRRGKMERLRLQELQCWMTAKAT